MDERIKRKLQKLHTLSQKGVDGEKEMSEKLLKQMLDKYGLKEEDFLEQETKHEYRIIYKNIEERRLITQCCAQFFDTISEEFNSVSISPSRKRWFITCTKADWILFDEFAKHHLKEYRKFKKLMMKTILQSYVESHRIFPVTSNSTKSSSDLTDEEMSALIANKHVADKTTEHISNHKQLGM